MARARNIKPSFFKNEFLADMKPHARLLFIGLWCLADREGYLEDRPKRIKGELFPYENVDVEEHLQALHSKGFIFRYEVDGERYIYIPKFSAHQNPHHREAPSKIPKPRQGNTFTEASHNQGKDEPRANTYLGNDNPEESTYQGSYSERLSQDPSSEGNGQKPHKINDPRKGSDEPRASTYLGNGKHPPRQVPASLIPDSFNLIPDSLNLIPDYSDPGTAADDDYKPNPEDPFVFYQTNFGVMNPFLTEDMTSWCKELSDELVTEAMKRAISQNKRTWAYVTGILKGWHSKGIKTIDQANAEQAEFERKKQTSGGRQAKEDKLPASVVWQQEHQQKGKTAKGISFQDWLSQKREEGDFTEYNFSDFMEQAMKSEGGVPT